MRDPSMNACDIGGNRSNPLPGHCGSANKEEHCIHLSTEEVFQKAYNDLSDRYGNHAVVGSRDDNEGFDENNADASDSNDVAYTIERDCAWLQEIARHHPAVFFHETVNGGMTLLDLSIWATVPVPILRTIYNANPSAISRIDDTGESVLVRLLKFNIHRIDRGSNLEQVLQKLQRQQRWVTDVATFILSVHPECRRQVDRTGRVPLHHALYAQSVYNPNLLRLLLSPEDVGALFVCRLASQARVSPYQLAWERRNRDDSFCIVQEALHARISDMIDRNDAGGLERLFIMTCQHDHVSHFEVLERILRIGAAEETKDDDDSIHAAADERTATTTRLINGRRPLHIILTTTLEHSPRNAYESECALPYDYEWHRATFLSEDGRTEYSEDDSADVPLSVLRYVIEKDPHALVVPERKARATPVHLFLERYLSSPPSTTLDSYGSHHAHDPHYRSAVEDFYFDSIIASCPTKDVLEHVNACGLTPLQLAAKHDCSPDFLYRHVRIDPYRQVPLLP